MKKNTFYTIMTAMFLIFFSAVTTVNADYIADHEEKKGVKTLINVVDKNGEHVTLTKTFEDVPFDNLTQAEIIDICYEYDVDPKLLFAIGYVETRWQSIPSYSGRSHGVWQINPESCRNFMWSGCDLYNPIDNAIVACQVLSVWRETFSDIRESLMAYNAGYDRSRWVPEYADKVLSAYNSLN